MPDNYDSPEQGQFIPDQYSAKETSSIGNLRRPSVRKQIEMQIVEVKERLDNLEKVLELLDRNPEIQDLLTLMRRIGI
jgi:hypothetical protein